MQMVAEKFLTKVRTRLEEGAEAMRAEGCCA